MLSVAAVAALQCPDALSRAIIAAGCSRIVICSRTDLWCLVDADDYGWLSRHSWNSGWHAKTKWKKYAKRNEGAARSTVYLHREVLKRHDPRDEEFYAEHHAHHLNGQSLDCRRANLGWRTASVNAAIRNALAACPPLESIVAQLAQKAGATAWRPRARRHVLIGVCRAWHVANRICRASPCDAPGDQQAGEGRQDPGRRRRQD